MQGTLTGAGVQGPFNTACSLNLILLLLSSMCISLLCCILQAGCSKLGASQGRVQPNLHG